MGKETVKETQEAAGDDQEWPIPCSSGCHNHKHSDKSDECPPKPVTEEKSGSGQLCWTPETGHSLEPGTSGQVTRCHQDHDTTGDNVNTDTMRKGVSVPNVSVTSATCDNSEADSVSCNSENYKSTKRGFFNRIKIKHKSDAQHSSSS